MPDPGVHDRRGDGFLFIGRLSVEKGLGLLLDAWRRHPDTEVLLTSDQPDKTWRYHVGVVTELFERVSIDTTKSLVLMCGPEIMMRLGVPILLRRGIPAKAIFVSLERHMECGIGLCGHCQIGQYFLCKDGPVMRYDRVESWLGRTGV